MSNRVFSIDRAEASLESLTLIKSNLYGVLSQKFII